MAGIERAEALVPGHQTHETAHTIDIAKKYAEERDKRVTETGTKQYIELAQSGRFSHFLEDPWIKSGTPINLPIPQDGRCRFAIIGAGFGGILFAVKLIQAGFKAEELVIVESAGGFGGTWYWNRYPGLMCDVESYIYLPLLEETGYIPTHKYASGSEIRHYCNTLAAKYGLHDRAMFQCAVQSLKWDAGSMQWDIGIEKKPKGGQSSSHFFHAQYVMVSPGLLANAHIPDVPGIGIFQSRMFHTARWDYEYTGGTPEDPTLSGLHGKRVAMIGTGATAVQAVPHLAKYAGELTVWQRTPSAVDVRNNRETDQNWFASDVATAADWYTTRNLNFNAHLEGGKSKPEQNLVDDEWTRHDAIRAFIGSPEPVTMENVGQYVADLHAMDFPRQQRIRDRAKDVVKDSAKARSLQAWYPGWCKRPCFHDEYLDAFNGPNVRLMDTNGRSIDRLTEKGIVFAGDEYEYDVIIFGTGFRSPGLGSAAGKSNCSIVGKNDVSMEDLAAAGELSTLHGISIRGFPNLFTPGVRQGASAANYAFVLDTIATHVAYILSEANKKSGFERGITIEPTQHAVDDWALHIMQGAIAFAGMAGCTPGYMNAEGETDRIQDQAAQMKSARNAVWSKGFNSYYRLLQEWRADGRMEGLDIAISGERTV